MDRREKEGERERMRREGFRTAKTVRREEEGERERWERMRILVS